jgi:hypothetical protein
MTPAEIANRRIGKVEEELFGETLARAEEKMRQIDEVRCRNAEALARSSRQRRTMTERLEERELEAMSADELRTEMHRRALADLDYDTVSTLLAARERADEELPPPSAPRGSWLRRRKRRSAR